MLKAKNIEVENEKTILIIQRMSHLLKKNYNKKHKFTKTNVQRYKYCASLIKETRFASRIRSSRLMLRNLT